MCYIGYLAISIVLYDCCSLLNGGIAHMPIALAHSFVVLIFCRLVVFFVPSYCMIFLWNTHFYFYLGGQSASLAALRLYNYIF